MLVQGINNYSNHNNTSFGKLHMNIAKIEKTVGSEFAKQAKEFMPELEKLAQDVNIKITSFRTTGIMYGLDVYVYPKSSILIPFLKDTVFAPHWAHSYITNFDLLHNKKLIDNVKSAKALYFQ